MAIVASGEISLGGNATATRSVACELGRSGTAAICMDESAVRTLAARTTAASAICMADFYGKEDAPAGMGCVFRGGYYTGSFFSPAPYYLIVAPNATGCACCQWKTTNSLTNNCSNVDCNCNNGYWNTFTYLNNADHPAGNWTATRSIGGFSDWYLPARNELNVLYLNKGTMPAGQGFASGSVDRYWSSSEERADSACMQFFYGGGHSFSYKDSTYRVRAVRRSGFTPPAAPTALGQFIQGGYYAGVITSPANYYLIVAPNATGCAYCRWKTANTRTNNCSNATCNCNNGYWNTFTYLNNADHPAGNWAATRSIGGFSDWYLPAENELNVFRTNRNSMPAGESACNDYWSSTETCAEFACVQNMSTGGKSGRFKSDYGGNYINYSFRAVRRVPF